MWESLGVLPAPAPSPTPTPETMQPRIHRKSQIQEALQPRKSQSHRQKSGFKEIMIALAILKLGMLRALLFVWHMESLIYMGLASLEWTWTDL